MDRLGIPGLASQIYQLHLALLSRVSGYLQIFKTVAKVDLSLPPWCRSHPWSKVPHRGIPAMTQGI